MGAFCEITLTSCFKGRQYLRRWLYASSLLETITINSRTLSTSTWSITAGWSRVITIWTVYLAYRTWADDRDDRLGAVNNIHCWMAWPRISGQVCTTLVTKPTSKTNCPKTILTPYLETHKDIATKSGETHVRVLPSCTFSRQSARDIRRRAKIHIFLIGDIPGGYFPSYTFLESFRWVDFNLNDATYRLRDTRFLEGQNFGFRDPLGVPPQKEEKTCLGPISTTLQNSTPISATVAEISVTGHRKKTANLVPCHTNVWRVKKLPNRSRSASYMYNSTIYRIRQ